MIDYTLLKLILLGEASILVLLMIFIVLHRVYRSFSEKLLSKKKEGFSSYYLSLIENKKPFAIEEHPPIGRYKKALLEVIEDFEKRVGGQLWQGIRKGVIDHFLIQKARRRANSWFWLKRNFAARIFCLQAYPEDEALILKLMDDRRFLVRSPASFASVYVESQKGVFKLFESIKNEYGYSQFVYLDALIKGSEKVFDYILDIAKDVNYHLIALKVLASRSWGREIPFLESNFQSDQTDIRYWSLKVLMRNPLPSSQQIFAAKVHEQDPRIRALSMEGLGAYPSDESAKILEGALSDSEWEVRLAAGKGLKRMGQLGINVLSRQKEGVALEVAKYVLVFG